MYAETTRSGMSALGVELLRFSKQACWVGRFWPSFTGTQGLCVRMKDGG